MNIILALHSLTRFVILLAAVIGLGKTVIALLQKSAPAKIDQTLASIFLGLFDLQLLLGLLIILLGGLTEPLHPIVMFVGLVAAHALQAMARRADGSAVQRNRLLFYVVPLAIILVGLAIIGRLPV